jgi:hypothetical protein
MLKIFIYLCFALSVSVPDLGSRDHDVVLVRHIACWGNPGGSGIWNGEGLGRVVEGEVSSRATWGQGGRNRTTQREGFQVSKGESKENQRSASKGSKKIGLCHIYIVYLYMCIHIIIV